MVTNDRKRIFNDWGPCPSEASRGRPAESNDLFPSTLFEDEADTELEDDVFETATVNFEGVNPPNWAARTEPTTVLPALLHERVSSVESFERQFDEHYPATSLRRSFSRLEINSLTTVTEINILEVEEESNEETDEAGISRDAIVEEPDSEREEDEERTGNN